MGAHFDASRPYPLVAAQPVEDSAAREAPFLPQLSARKLAGFRESQCRLDIEREQLGELLERQHLRLLCGCEEGASDGRTLEGADRGFRLVRVEMRRDEICDQAALRRSKPLRRFIESLGFGNWQSQEDCGTFRRISFDIPMISEP
jgi:hypothetical protein